MKKEIFDIKVPYEKAGLPSDGLNPTLTAYTIDVSPEIGKKSRPAVIVCPGGGYEFVSDREADPIALRFAAFGIHAFVLRYSVVNKPFPTALLEAASALAFVRKNAKQWDINPNKIFICGFSAGGHLAASLATLWDKDFVKNPLGFADEHKPNGAILGYPVIVSGEYAHEGSIRNIIGENPSKEKLELVSLEKQVSPKTPPVFIWHAADDGCVPVENTLFFTTALSKNKIPFESHIYPQGGHGISLCDDTTSGAECQYNEVCAEWFAKAVRFIKNL